MTGLVRGELLKLRTTRTPLAFGFAVAALAAIGTAVTALTTGMEGTGSPPLDSAEGSRQVFAAGLDSAGTFALVLGIIVMSGEWRHRTATHTFLVTPRRDRVVAAKLLATLVASTGYALLAVAVVIAVALPVLRIKQADVGLADHDIPLVLIGGALSAVLYGIVGVGIGALVRNQVAAIVGALLADQLVGGLLVGLLPAVGKWTPAGAKSALSLVTIGDAELLPAWGGGLLLIGYALVFAAVGSRLVVSRDIT